MVTDRASSQVTLVKLSSHIVTALQNRKGLHVSSITIHIQSNKKLHAKKGSSLSANGKTYHSYYTLSLKLM